MHASTVLSGNSGWRSIENSRSFGPQVTCVIPGHDRSGEELVTDDLQVSDDALQFEYHGNCGYAATFDYSG